MGWCMWLTVAAVVGALGDASMVPFANCVGVVGAIATWGGIIVATRILLNPAKRFSANRAATRNAAYVRLGFMER